MRHYERKIMFGVFKGDEPSIYDEPIKQILANMDEYGPDSPEYTTLMNHLEGLVRIRAEHRPKRISPDTMAIVAGNLMGILIIVAYEQKHVMTSKAMGFILKTK